MYKAARKKSIGVAMKRQKTLRMDPAHSIILYLGGYPHVASILGMSRSRVVGLTLPRVQGGSDGVIDYKKMIILLSYAKNYGVDLRPDDFLDAYRLRRIMAKYEDKMGLGVRVKCGVCHTFCSFPVSEEDVPWMSVRRKKRSKRHREPETGDLFEYMLSNNSEG